MNCSKLSVDVTVRASAISFTPTVVEGTPLSTDELAELNSIIEGVMAAYCYTVVRPQMIASVAQDLYTAILVKLPKLKVEITTNGDSMRPLYSNFCTALSYALYEEFSSKLTFMFPPTQAGCKPTVHISGSLPYKWDLNNGFSIVHFHGRFIFKGLSLVVETHAPEPDTYNIHATYDKVLVCTGFNELETNKREV